MLYSWTGRELTGNTPSKRDVITERLTRWESLDRYHDEQSRALSPAKLGQIFAAANSGDPAAQAKLAEEILEKDWDTIHAVGTRVAAVEGVALRVKAADEKNPTAVRIAEAAQAMLDGVEPDSGRQTDLSTRGLIANMMGALLPGYDCCEIQWSAGGKGIEAFTPVPRDAITFNLSREPKIATTNTPTGLGLAPNKFIFHRHRARSGDATRGGLIRPLGWMFLFGNLGIKDLLRFVEKFGMPFVSARLDDNAWKNDRHVIADLVQNFGSDGGGVFSKAVELEFTEAGNSTGEVYFKLMEYFGDAKSKVVLGQTASSGDSAGLSGGDAQSAVRQDILEADCGDIGRTLRTDLLTPWTAWNYGPDAPVPVATFACEPPEDRKQEAEIAGSVSSNMGYELDAEWVEQKFGVKLARDAAGLPVRKQVQANAMAFSDVLTLSDGVKKNTRHGQVAASGGPSALLPPMTRW